MWLDAVLFPLFLSLLYFLGAGVLRLPKADGDPFPLYFYFITSLFTLGCLAVLVNFFTGVNSFAYYAVLGVITIIGIVRSRAADFALLKRYLPYSLLLVPMAAFLPAGADAGLYHIPHQLLIRDEKVIFGLANLHSRYGFSSMLEYVMAPLWVGERLKLLSYAHAAFIALWLLFLWEWITSANRYKTVIAKLTAASMLLFCMYVDFAYTSTDTPSGLMFALAFLYGLGLLLEDGPIHKHQLVVLFISALFAFMCKLSGAIVLAWVGLVVIVLLCQRRLVLRDAIYGSLLPAALLSGWLVKNVVVSGCVIYPSIGTFLDVPWAATANATENLAGVTAWARRPGHSLRPLEDWYWFQEWWWPYYRAFLFYLCCAAIVLSAAYITTHKTYKTWRRLPMISATAFVGLGLGFWFFKAPTPRFGIGIFIVLLPILITTIFGFRSTQYAKLQSAHYVLIILLAMRLGVATNTDVMRSVVRTGFYFNTLTPPTVTVKDAPNFGFKPAATTAGADSICWTAKYCAPDARPPIREAYGYKYFPSL